MSIDELTRQIRQACAKGQHVPRDMRASWVLGWLTAGLEQDEKEALFEYLMGGRGQ